MSVLNDRRIVIFIGHFGSGKTECAVNYAITLRGATDGKVAIADLDIANPYFRSREKKDMMEAMGIENLSNMYGKMITDEVPALDPQIRRPLENKEYRAVVDAGGDPSGAKLLVQYSDLLKPEDCDVFAVVNANRPETATAPKAIHLIEMMQAMCGMKITAVFNNTHMIRLTTVDDIIKGNKLAKEVARHFDVSVRYNTCETHLLDALKQATADAPLEGEIFPITLQMRDTWLDDDVR